MNKRTKYIFAAVVIVIVGWMIADSFLQPGTADLKGDLKELAFVRNEQNTGPVIRIYAVSLQDTLWNSMQSYGNYMPHTKYGLTRVYFFLNNGPLPKSGDLSVEADNLPDNLKAACVAVYEKNVMGKVSLIRYPFAVER